MSGTHSTARAGRLSAATLLALALAPAWMLAPAGAQTDDADWEAILALAAAEDQALAGGDADALVAAACLRAQSGITIIDAPDPAGTLLQAAARRGGSRVQKARVARALAAWRAGSLATAPACGGAPDVLRGVDGIAEFRFTLAPGRPHLEPLAVRAGEPLRLLVLGDIDSRVGLVLRDEAERRLCEQAPEGRTARCQGFPKGTGQRRWSLQVSTAGRLPVRARLYVK
jgi:hypothetical protein